MPVPIIVPQMGESVVEGTIGRWLKAEGDPIRKDETVVEIMTDKINVELPAIEAGTLGKILVPEGTVVGIGTQIGIILGAGESLPAGVASAKPAAAMAASAQSSQAAMGASTLTLTRPSEDSDEVKRSSPVVRRLLREHNLRLQEIPASGAGGRVTKEDVLNFVRVRPSSPTAAPSRPMALSGVPKPAFQPATVARGEETIERVPLAGVRKLIAEHMIRSKQTSAHVMSMDEVDLSELVRVRNEKKDDWQHAAGANVTFMPFFVKSVVAALKEFPSVNASIDGNQILYRKYYHIGVAVARDEGLIVPVVRFADQKSILQIAREISDLSERARRDQLKLDEIHGSTFTLTNAGMFGALASTPVINQPEVAILGMHMIQKRPVVRDDQIVIRDMMYLTISFDHRLIDGHTAVQFLRRVCERLEDPYEMLLTI